VTSTEERLAGALRTIADERPPPPLPGDLWPRGRRRRHRQVAALVSAAVAVVAVAVPLVADYRIDATPLPPAGQPPAIPSAVHAPVAFARTVDDSPPGPAAVVVTGDFGRQLSAQTLVVGRNGGYRVMDATPSDWAGDHVHLSPDGRRLSLGGEVGGAGGSVIDLVTGMGQGVDIAGPPVAWSPDGRLLMRDRRSSGLQLVDLESGQVRLISATVAENASVAFSADGSLLALQRGSTLDLIDVATGRGFRQLEVGRLRWLAGPGAWTADGKLALWELPASCENSCTVDSGGAGEFGLVLLDPGTAGYSSAGFDAVVGSVPRLLGWRPDGAAVVLTHRPAVPSEPADEPARTPSDARIVALVPGGGTTDLVDLPTGAYGVELAADLVRAGRFGGPTPGLLTRFGDTLNGIVEMVWPLAAAVLLGYGAWRVTRRLRRPWSRPPAS
jgi:hypothetical protein